MRSDVVNDEGVQFPTGADGRRSTMATNRAISTDAAQAVDEDLARGMEAAQEWRREYLARVRGLTTPFKVR
jgi:hypothetical protein